MTQIVTYYQMFGSISTYPVFLDLFLSVEKTLSPDLYYLHNKSFSYMIESLL